MNSTQIENIERGETAKQQGEEMKGLHNALQSYTTGYAQPPPEPPQTFVIECNKTMAIQDGNAKYPNRWTNQFPPIKLKKGDVVSVNSAFLSNRGSGDLIQFDSTNNKTRIVFEYYGTNDNANFKRPAYNIRGAFTDTYGYTPGYFGKNNLPQCFIPCYPANYRPMRLYRLMRTFYDSQDDFLRIPPPGNIKNPLAIDPATFPAITGPNAPDVPNNILTLNPYKTDTNEPFWGKNQASRWIYEGAEDDYVPGLIRNPMINIRQFSVFSSPYHVDDPTNISFFGANQQVRIWYISTQYSKYGACSDNATMRIYLVYGTNDTSGGGVLDGITNGTIPFLKQLRVGMNIQIRNTDALFGSGASVYNHIDYSAGTYPQFTPRAMTGSNVFYCSGYDNWGDGFTNAEGITVDKFEQVGKNSGSSYKNDYNFSALGEVMKVVNINMGNNSLHPDFDQGSLPSYRGGYVLQSAPEYLPFFEVQATRAISICFGNPNMVNVRAHNGYNITPPFNRPTVSGVPWLGAYQEGRDSPADYEGIGKASFCSTGLSFCLRDWYCGNTITQENVTAIIPSNVEKATTYAFNRGIRHSLPLPKEDLIDPQTVLDEKLYFAFRPYYYHPADGTYPAEMNTAFSLELKEQSLRDCETEIGYTNNIGLTGPDNLVAHNYNLLTKSKSNLNVNPDFIKYGSDIKNDVGANEYAGGRMPRYYNGNNEPAQYTTTSYSSASRVGVHNQGEDYFYALYGYDNTIDYVGGNGGRATAQNNVISNANDIWFSVNNVARANFGMNPDSGLMTANENGQTIRFYFSCNIDDISPHHSGAFPFNSNGDIWDKTEAFRSPDQICGMKNYIWAAANLPPSRVVNEANIITRPWGLWYGYDDLFKVTMKTPHTSPTCHYADNIFDYVQVLAQFPGETYARFHDTYTGKSELMYIKILSQKINVCGSAGNLTNLNAGTKNETTNTPYLFYSDGNNDRINDAYVPSFLILARDIERKGKLVFFGADSDLTGNPTTFSASAGTNLQYYNSKNPTANNNKDRCYFELFNGWAQMEHQIRVDNYDRDIIPLSYDNATDNIEYKNNFAFQPDGTVTPNGTPCGGDFYLTKIPNLPFIDETGLFRTSDNMLLLADSLVRGGNPTRQEKFNGADPNDPDSKHQHTGKLQWDIQYDYVDIDMGDEKNYYSPTDIANLVTETLHKPKDLYKSWDNDIQKGGGNFPGGQFDNTAGKLPLNALFRQIHGPSHIDRNNPKDDNTWDQETGNLSGLYHEGDFKFVVDISQNMINNAINGLAWTGGSAFAGLNGAVPKSGTNPDEQVKEFNMPKAGKYDVHIPSQNTYMNTIPSTDWYIYPYYGFQDKVPPATLRTIYTDYDYKGQGRGWGEHYDKTECFGSMFCGTNNAQLNYNTDISRFEWKYLHQPLYSEWSLDKQTGQSVGGDIIAKIWSQAVKGMDNWDRYGGINIVNWRAPVKPFGLVQHSRDLTYQDPLTFQDPVGNAFMNKLGFNDEWIATNSNSDNYPDAVGTDNRICYRPKGTTSSDYDVAQSLSYNQFPNVFDKGRIDYRNDGRSPHIDSTTPANDNTWSFGASDYSDVTMGGAPSGYFNGANPFAKPPLSPSTAKVPASQPWNDEIPIRDYTVQNTGATIGYSFSTTMNSPPSTVFQRKADGISRIPIKLNLDDVKYPSLSVQVDSSGLIAPELPKKTTIGYFLIMSDVVDKHEFLASANNGSHQKCLGILSKNYENNDFFFSFQSPVEFHIKQDRTITSIKTEILTPQLTDPIGLDINSSVIYSVVRAQPVPEPDVPPISIQQAYDYGMMEQLTQSLGINTNAFGGTSQLGMMGINQNMGGGAGLNLLRQNLVQSVLSPNANTAINIYQTQTEISGTLSRMGVGERLRLMRTEGIGLDPTQITQPLLPSMIREEDINQPPVIGDQNYLSPEQLAVQELDFVRNQQKPQKAGSAESHISRGMYADIPDTTHPNFGMGNIGGGFASPLSPPPSEIGNIINNDMAQFREDMFETLSEHDIGNKSIREIHAESADSSRRGTGKGLPALGLADFYGKYLANANELTRNQHSVMAQSGWRPENPDTWEMGQLTAFAGRNNDFEPLGEGMYQQLGATINLEGRTKILQTIGKYSSMSGKEVQQQREGARSDMLRFSGHNGTSFQIPNIAREYGNESLMKRLSRTNPFHKLSKADEKSIGDTGGAFSHSFKGENPYDMRTWDKGIITKYATIAHFGVPEGQRTKETKLDKKGNILLTNELNRRESAGLGSGKVRLDEHREYKNKKKAPLNYDAKNQHLTPHISVGAVSLKSKEGKEKTFNISNIQGKVKIPKSPLSAQRKEDLLDKSKKVEKAQKTAKSAEPPGLAWSKGYFSSYAPSIKLAGGNKGEHKTYYEAQQIARAYPNKVGAITRTRNKKSGDTTYSPRKGRFHKTVNSQKIIQEKPTHQNESHSIAVNKPTATAPSQSASGGASGGAKKQ
jgi:hypothetical protein